MKTEDHFRSLRSVIGQYTNAMHELVWTMVNVRPLDSLEAIERELAARVADAEASEAAARRAEADRDRLRGVLMESKSAFSYIATGLRRKVLRPEQLAGHARLHENRIADALEVEEEGVYGDWRDNPGNYGE